VEVRERLDLETKRAGFNVEQMSAVQTVIRKEVEVVAGDAEGASEAGRPQAEQRAVNIGKAEFALGLRRIDKARVLLRRVHSTGSDPIEVPIQTNGVEYVVRTPVPVAAIFEIFKAGDRLGFKLDDTSYSTSVPLVRWRLAKVASMTGWRCSSQSSAA
jgi:hypothetical protein